MFTFTNNISPAASRAAAANSGAIIRHGPHHGAQKSITTGNGHSRLNAPNALSLSTTTGSATRGNSPLHPPHRPRRSSFPYTIRFTVPHAGQSRITPRASPVRVSLIPQPKHAPHTPASDFPRPPPPTLPRGLSNCPNPAPRQPDSPDNPSSRPFPHSPAAQQPRGLSHNPNPRTAPHCTAASCRSAPPPRNRRGLSNCPNPGTQPTRFPRLPRLAQPKRSVQLPKPRHPTCPLPPTTPPQGPSLIPRATQEVCLIIQIHAPLPTTPRRPVAQLPPALPKRSVQLPKPSATLPDDPSHRRTIHLRPVSRHAPQEACLLARSTPALVPPSAPFPQALSLRPHPSAP